MPPRHSPADLGLWPCLRHRLLRVWHPAWFQGEGRKRRYFEGWYFKIVSANGSRRYAIIPGLSLGSGPADAHAFIQVLDGLRGRAWYFRYPLEDFKYGRGRFALWLGGNYFDDHGLQLDLRGQGLQMQGAVRWNRTVPWPVAWLRPGVMGWYAFVPAMECYHGVLSMQHALTGALTVNGRLVDFGGGRGYWEKDWGTSFPAAWVWMQSNHFEAPETSFFCSVAKIPWLGRHFTGVIAGLWHAGQLHRFATYAGASITRLECSATRLALQILAQDRRLAVEVLRQSATVLAAPVRGDMRGHVRESLRASVHVRFSTGRDQEHTVFEGSGRIAGLEVQGDLAALRAEVA